MKVNYNFVIEKLDDGSAVLLDPQNEMIFILNRTGYFILETANDHSRECAKTLYFTRTNLPLIDDYSNDYELCLSQLIENGIILEG